MPQAQTNDNAIRRRIGAPPPARGHSCPQQASKGDALRLVHRPTYLLGVAADRNVRAPGFGVVPRCTCRRANLAAAVAESHSEPFAMGTCCEPGRFAFRLPGRFIAQMARPRRTHHREPQHSIVEELLLPTEPEWNTNRLPLGGSGLESSAGGSWCLSGERSGAPQRSQNAGPAVCLQPPLRPPRLRAR
jgi:hypothetical protein